MGEHRSVYMKFVKTKMSFKRQGTTAKSKKNIFQSYVSFIVNNETFLFVYSVFLLKKKTHKGRSFTDMDNLETRIAVLLRDLQKLEQSVYPNY